MNKEINNTNGCYHMPSFGGVSKRNEYMKAKIRCPICGKMYNRSNKTAHVGTKFHQSALCEIEEKEDPDHDTFCELQNIALNPNSDTYRDQLLNRKKHNAEEKQREKEKIVEIIYKLLLNVVDKIENSKKDTITEIKQIFERHEADIDQRFEKVAKRMRSHEETLQILRDGGDKERQRTNMIFQYLFDNDQGAEDYFDQKLERSKQTKMTSKL